MMRDRSPNFERLLLTATALRPVLDELVFVGGNVAELLVTDAAAPRIRETDDVDVIVRVSTYTQYENIGERLSALGFTPDTSPGAPACRWLTPTHRRGRTKLDVMPTAATTIGPTNPWYETGMASAIPFDLTKDLQIRILSAPVFLATKWAAFDSRGHNDILMSHDVEDILAVVAGRASLLDEMSSASNEVQAYVRERIGYFLRQEDADAAIEDAMPDTRLSPGIVSRTRARLTALAGNLRPDYLVAGGEAEHDN